MFKRYLPYFSYLKPIRFQFIAGLLTGITYGISSGFGLPLFAKTVFPILFQDAENVENVPRWFVDAVEFVFGSYDRDILLIASCVAIPLIFSLRALSQFANSYLMSYCGLKVVESVRVDFFKHLQRLPVGFFQKHPSGDLMARLMGDTETIRTVVINTTNDLIKHPFTLLSAVSFLVYLAITEESFFFAGIGALSVPLCVLPIRYVGKHLAKRSRQLAHMGGEHTAYTIESLQSPLEVRAYNLQEQQVAGFKQRVSALIRMILKVVRYNSMLSPLIEVVAAAGLSLALYMGVTKGMGLELFIALAFALYMAYEPVKKLGKLFGQLRSVEGPLDRIEAILHEPISIADPEHPKAFPSARGHYTFDRVSFAYNDTDGQALKEVSVSTQPGDCIALVGPSGAGKTTFAHMLCRFYDPLEGRISLDGIGLQEVTQHDLREQIAVVTQTPILFNCTIKENILLGKMGATDAAVVAAAKRAHIDDFIRQLPRGYDTMVSERGSSLSGGQRQRIALARAFLRDAPILILDEATSALDSESEEAIQQAMNEIVQGRTTFIIAHRFSSISMANRILLFDQGRIVADGSHEELFESSSLYRRLAQLQMMDAADESTSTSA